MGFIFENKARNDELTDTERVIIRLFMTNPTISVREISKKMIRPGKSHIQKLLVDFERRGFIRRKPLEADARKIFTSITEKGYKAIK